MILSKAPTLTPSQLSEVEKIVAEFGCSIQPIHGAHRDVYAIIGDERSETMINRLLGLECIDRVDRMESIYKLMDVRSGLSQHRVRIGPIELGREPLIIAGQCTIDPRAPNYFLETAHAVREAGAKALRGGVWKPRTSPHSFQGDARSLEVLMEARAATGLPVVTEVMERSQVEAALEAGVDVLQIGTRNALNYSLLRAVGELTASRRTPVLLKRAMHMGSIDEFIAAAEYIVAGGNPNVVLCPRGTNPRLDGYRNHPDESITPLLRQKTWAPVVADPSHSVGRAQYVPACALAAICYGADGVVIESHVDPRCGIGDDPLQSVSPAVLKHLVEDISAVWAISRRGCTP